MENQYKFHGRFLNGFSMVFLIVFYVILEYFEVNFIVKF